RRRPQNVPSRQRDRRPHAQRQADPPRRRLRRSAMAVNVHAPYPRPRAGARVGFSPGPGTGYLHPHTLNRKGAILKAAHHPMVCRGLLTSGCQKCRARSSKSSEVPCTNHSSYGVETLAGLRCRDPAVEGRYRDAEVFGDFLERSALAEELSCVSIASVRLIKSIPPSHNPPAKSSRSLTLRPRRSSFHTTRVSPLRSWSSA
ncbi:UNVERIFIED_ORG: hypothetical protein ABID57_000292, partial [Arthrobacter sp. UYEF1]